MWLIYATMDQNELIPATGELSACLLIEYETPAERDIRRRKLLGLERRIWLETAGQQLPAKFDDRPGAPRAPILPHRTSGLFPASPPGEIIGCQNCSDKFESAVSGSTTVERDRSRVPRRIPG